MTAIDKPTTSELIYRGVKKSQVKLEELRTHLGASQIGKSCSRELWYQFRWADQEEFDGRMFRLFRRGKDEEEKITKDLRAGDIEVIDINPSTKKQWRFTALGGHFGAELDAIGRGFPEDTSKQPKWHDLEYKTHNKKSFDALVKNGVAKAKPQHYAQMQIGMHLSGATNENRLTRAMYIAVHKDTDTVYTERVKYVQAEAKELMEKAERVIFSEEPPPRIKEDPSWYECKWCTFSNICHGDKLPQPTCRSCAHSTAQPDGTWTCADTDDSLLSAKEQWFGCGNHVYNPHVVKSALNCEQGDGSSEENWIEYVAKDGKPWFKNGTRALGVYTSAELYNLDPRLIGDEGIEDMRAEFGAAVVASKNEAILTKMEAEAKDLGAAPFEDEIPF